MRRKKGSPYYNNRHSCYLLQYHLVLVTKFRHPVLTGTLKEELYDLIRGTCEKRGVVILELNGEADHVHLLFEAEPYFPLGEFINVVKTRTSRHLRKKYDDTLLKKWYWKPYFWSDSYFVTTVSEQSLSLVRQYIQEQGNSPTTNA